MKLRIAWCNVAIALTAPGRWVRDRLRRRQPVGGGAGRGRGFDGGPPPAGVREPRRPRPPVTSGAAARPWPPED